MFLYTYFRKVLPVAFQFLNLKKQNHSILSLHVFFDPDNWEIRLRGSEKSDLYSE